MPVSAGFAREMDESVPHAGPGQPGFDEIVVSNVKRIIVADEVVVADGPVNGQGNEDEAQRNDTGFNGFHGNGSVMERLLDSQPCFGTINKWQMANGK